MTDPRVFAAYASRYDESVQAVIGASGESVEYFARLKAQLAREISGGRRPGDILDFGCGIGNTTRCLASMFPGAALTGFDLSAPSIDAAPPFLPTSGRRSAKSSGANPEKVVSVVTK